MSTSTVEQLQNTSTALRDALAQQLDAAAAGPARCGAQAGL